MANLNLDQVAANQNQKEATINDALDQLDSAVTDRLAIDLSAAGVTLTPSQWTRNIFYDCVGHAVARTVIFPATKRLVVFKNSGTASVTLQISGGGSAVLTAGTGSLVYCDGTNLTLIGGGTGSLAFKNLTDVPSSYVGIGGNLLRIKKDESGVESYVAGGSGWKIPKLSSFTKYDLGAIHTVTDVADGISIVSSGADGGRSLVLVLNTLITDPNNWSFEAELVGGIAPANYQAVGLGLMSESLQARALINGTDNQNLWYSKHTGGMSSGTMSESLAGVATGLIGVSQYSYGTPLLLKFGCTAGTLKASLSLDSGNTYRQVFSAPLSTYFGGTLPSDFKPGIEFNNSSSSTWAYTISKYRFLNPS